MIIANYDFILWVYKDTLSLVVWAYSTRVDAARLGCHLASAPALPVPEEADIEQVTTSKDLRPELADRDPARSQNNFIKFCDMLWSWTIWGFGSGF